MLLKSRRMLSILLILVMTAYAMPVFAAKKASGAKVGALSCDRDYGFSYKNKAVSKGAADVAMDLLKTVGKVIGTKVVEGAVNWGLSNFFNSVFGIEQVDVGAEFNKVNGKLDEIKNMLDKMYREITIADFRGTIQNRDQKYNELKPEVVSRMNRLLQADTEKERKEVVLDWAGKSMMSSSSGVTATSQWGNLISSSMGGYTYIQCYDGYAKLAFPWEHDGYDFRDAARTADLTLYIDACVLTGLYYNLVIAGEVEGKSEKSERYNIDAFKKQMNDVIDYFSQPANQVVRDEGKNQCQITGMTDFAVYVNDTYEGYKWNDCDGHHRYFDDLMKQFYTQGAYVNGGHGRTSVPLKSARLKKLMEFYPGLFVGQILIDKIGVKGMRGDYDHDVILLDQNYKIFDDHEFSPTLQIAVNSVRGIDRNISDASFCPVGECKPISPFDKTQFGYWYMKGNYDWNKYYIICSDDKSDGEPNSDDMQGMTGTISKVAEKSVTLLNEYDLEVKFDTTSAVIEGTCEVGLEAEVLYHDGGDGRLMADAIRVKMPVTLLNEQTMPGVVVKHKDGALTVKGADKVKYKFELSFNTGTLEKIPRNTPITVTYQPGDDGKRYVTRIENLQYESPILTSDALTMEKGDTLKLSTLAKVPGTWMSGDESVLKITKDHKLKAVGAGETELLFLVGMVTKSATHKGATVNSGDNVAIPVTVKAKGSQIQSITIKPKKPVVMVGGTVQLTASWKPKTAVETALSWKSSNESIATVDATGLVTGIAAGKATMTATAPSGATKNRVVTVKPES